MNSDSDDQIDITSALLPTKRAKRAPSKAATKIPKIAPVNLPFPVENLNPFDHDSDAEEDELFSTLPSLTRSKNLAEGTAVVKGRKDLKATKGLTGGGSFQSLGLPAPLLKALLQRGFTTPTPIQRMALPSILGSTSTETTLGGKKLIVARDHLCMARTGSGKTLCYLLPLLAQLLTHSTVFGARGLILVPTRELALQVIKVGKDLSRGLKGDGESLRWAMVVGGEGMEDQFSMMAGNPDVIIATPGRLLHLIVEMNLDLRAIQYCVFDEADRLFELGFAEQLHEILFKMPPTRQTLLFSATLPSTLVGFAKAGLQSPKLIRLDVDSKISKELQMAYLSVKTSEKEAMLLGVLREVIGVPLMSEKQKALQDEYIEDEADDEERGRAAYKSKAKGVQRKRLVDDEAKRPDDYVDPSAHQTLVFVSTKHHVEYISNLLVVAGYAVSTIYGSMDQTARRLHLAKFRAGRTSILVVTDLAARGIDIPGVENVVNYDFPNGARAFVHRVGRTARAGRKGWAFSFITQNELPHLLDLQLFLGRPIKTCPLLKEGEVADENIIIDYSDQIILGTAPRNLLDLDYESYKTLINQFPHIETLGNVSRRGQKMYERGISKASAESYRRAKELAFIGKGLAISTSINPVMETESVHPIFLPFLALTVGDHQKEIARSKLMTIVNAFTPTETVFEVGTKGKTTSNQLMKDRRIALKKSVAARNFRDEIEDEDLNSLSKPAEDDEDERKLRAEKKNPLREEDADETEVAAVFETSKKRKRAPGESYRDPNFYLDYEQEGADTERGYALTAGDSFGAQAQHATFDLSGKGDNEGTSAEALLQRASSLRWDRRTKKFIKGDGIGADNKKMVKSESGQKLPASFKSGVFDDWRKKVRISVPKVGEAELKGKTVTSLSTGAGGKSYRHKAQIPKTDEQRRIDKLGGRAKVIAGTAGGLKSSDQIRKDRNQKEFNKKRSGGGSKGGKGSKSGGAKPARK